MGEKKITVSRDKVEMVNGSLVVKDAELAKVLEDESRSELAEGQGITISVSVAE